MTARLSTMPPPRRPGLAKCGGLELRVALRDALRSWMRSNVVSRLDLARILGCSPRRIDDFYTGYAPLPYDLLSALPPARAWSLRIALDAAAESLRKSA